MKCRAKLCILNFFWKPVQLLAELTLSAKIPLDSAWIFADLQERKKLCDFFIVLSVALISSQAWCPASHQHENNPKADIFLFLYL